MNRDELIKFLLDTYASQEVLAFDIWNRGDVEKICSDENLSDEELDAVLYSMYEDKDCNTGLNNDFVYQKIEEVIAQRDEEEE